MITRELPSGAKINITEGAFAESRSALQTVMRTIQNVPIVKDDDKLKVLKRILAASLSSPAVDAEVWVLFKRCNYEPKDKPMEKITTTTFDTPEGRADYLTACVEVLFENISPFLKGLSSEFATLQIPKE